MLPLSPRGRLIEFHCPQKPGKLAYSGEQARIDGKALLAVQITQRIQKGAPRLSQAIGLRNGYGLGKCSPGFSMIGFVVREKPLEGCSQANGITGSLMTCLLLKQGGGLVVGIFKSL